MQPQHSINQLLKRLWQHVSIKRQNQFILVLGLMIFTSFSEIISIGAVIPFLAALTTPTRIFELPIAQPIIKALGLTEPTQLLLFLTTAFGLAALLAGIMRLVLLWASTRVSFATGSDLSIDIYRRTLYQPYSVHCARNSSEIISGISTKIHHIINGIIGPLMTLISSSIILTAILLTLLYVDPLIAITAFGGFGSIYITIILLTRKKLLSNSKIQAHESIQVIKSLQEGLGGIRDVLIDGNQEIYCQIYNEANQKFRKAQSINSFISAAPRYAMEALGMLMIAALAYTATQQTDGVAKAIPILGAIALGAQRLLPVLQQAYGSWTLIRGNQISLEDTLNLLDQPLPNDTAKISCVPISFKDNIHFEQIHFRYTPQAPYLFKNITFTIKKGSRVGFMGTTGSGKSTLLDIVMGLLKPTKGTLLIDGTAITPKNQRSWQAHIAHVPQAIFIFDMSVEENIAFGVPKNQIDTNRVRLAAQQAQISHIIEAWPQQYQTVVGERGIRLSGGQRQRIGIARALYKQADVIIFDEATSALDNETEASVMQAIENLSGDITTLIIAHRLTTLKNCTHIFELDNGKISHIGKYQDIKAVKRIVEPL